MCLWEGEITVDLEWDLLSVCLGKGQGQGAVVCCSGGLHLCFSVSWIACMCVARAFR